MKPYYQDEWVTIYNMDCREGMKEIPDGSIDLVLTDPPYGVDFADWDSLQSFDWLEVCRKLSHLVFVITGTTHLQDYPKADWVACWARPGSVQRAKGGGFSHWEPILIYGKNPLDYDCKVFTANTDSTERNHPCPKPEKVISWLLQSSKTKGLILDPFLGSGTTAYCAKKLNRHCIGFEISEKYCAIAAKRCSQMVFNLDIPEYKPEPKRLPEIDCFGSWVNADGTPWVTPKII